MVGYLSASIRSVADARVGDTISHYSRRAKQSLPGYKEATPMVFCGLFPVDADQFPELRDALEKLQLNDAALKIRQTKLGSFRKATWGKPQTVPVTCHPIVPGGDKIAE
ncbi:small GTP-binding protein [Actinidia rufa]|uniref:Small GTP-binding protein n=1 Tax=Actinidia rufa TaxID=165716 RepID=A0A7J0F580_9ERIC|nr:small GTP-binding protein [Actinidia rufa]